MLRRDFDPKKPYGAVVYLRMSSDQQNARSPDQQLDEIQRRIKAMNLPWRIIKEYRDAGISGRLVRKRLGFQDMLQDIKTGAVKADIILVDTIERFGRVDELPAIRKELYQKSGILVLTADSNFADPNTPQGKALGMFEAMRATEDGRIKAHNVLRGKRDAALQKHWPGGPPPFGYKLQSVMTEVNGCAAVDHRILVRDPATDWIIALLFTKAVESGWGTVRLAEFLSNHPDIPRKLTPFHAATVGHWLSNPIYYGELLFCKTSTDIIDDARVVEQNAEEDRLSVPGFCEPIVTREQWDTVNSLRSLRREQIRRQRRKAHEGNGKLIAPPAPGMVLKYLLTGLVRCGLCGRSMTPSSSGNYKGKDGQPKRKVSYVCPGYPLHICTNGRRIPEKWLRQVIVAKIQERLFPWVK